MGQTKSKAGDNSAVAVIEGGDIVIRVAIDAIPCACKAGIGLGTIDPGFEVSDANLFAKDLVRALNDEDEDGTTPIHRLFDDAINEAIEQGAEGIAESDYDPADGDGDES